METEKTRVKIKEKDTHYYNKQTLMKRETGEGLISKPDVAFWLLRPFHLAEVIQIPRHTRSL